MQRRTFLAGSAVSFDPAYAQYLRPKTQPLALSDIGSAAARLRARAGTA